MKIYHCEDSLEGIFTAIYNTYEDHCIIRDTMVTTIEEMDSRYGRINFYISPKRLYEETGFLWKGERQ